MGLGRSGQALKSHTVLIVKNDRGESGEEARRTEQTEGKKKLGFKSPRVPYIFSNSPTRTESDKGSKRGLASESYSLGKQNLTSSVHQGKAMKKIAGLGNALNLNPNSEDALTSQEQGRG